jgi:flagellar biogenesis protein FliO
MKSTFRKTYCIIAITGLALASCGAAMAAGNAGAQPASNAQVAQSQQSSIAASVGWAVMSRTMGLAQPPKTETKPTAEAAAAKPAATAVKPETGAPVSGTAPAKVTAQVEETHDAYEHSEPTTVAQVEERPKAETSHSATAVSVTAPAARTGLPTAQPQSNTAARTDRIVQFAHEKEVQDSPREKAGSVKMGFSVILKLILVLGLAYLSILALKLLSTKRGIVSGARQDLKVTDTIKLTPTNSLHMVEINGKKILVGSSSGQVNLLREFEEEEIPQEQTATEGRFSEYLSKYSGLSNEKTPAGRVAGLLRDCATHLKNRQDDAETAYHIVANTKEA